MSKLETNKMLGVVDICKECHGEGRGELLYFLDIPFLKSYYGGNPHIKVYDKCKSCNGKGFIEKQ